MFKDERPTKEKKEVFQVNEPDLSPEQEAIAAVRKKKQPKAPKEQFEYEESESFGASEPERGYLIDLPSAGKHGYPSTVTYRDIMAGDEEILKTATRKNYARTVNSVLKSVCNNASFFDDMTVHDRDFVLTYIWANTYDPVKSFEIKCRHCGNVEEKKIDMTEVDVTDIKENFLNKFPLKISKADKTIHIRPVKVRDENAAEKFKADNKEIKDGIEYLTMVLAIDFGHPMALRERIDWVKDNVSAKEMGNIKKYHEHFFYGLDTTFTHDCSECEGVTPSRIPFHPEDIIAPKVRSDFDELLSAIENSGD